MSTLKDHLVNRKITISTKNLLKKEIINPENHITENSWNYSYTNHAVTRIDTTQTNGRFNMQYDAVGNMVYQADTKKNVIKESTFDSQNRITRVNDGNTSSVIGSYWYDDQGFRVRKIGKKNFDGVDGQIEVLYPSMYFGLEKQRDTDGTIVPNTEYAINNIYLNGVRIAAVMPDGTAQYYLTDQVNSVKVVTDDGGIPVTNTEYLPYGESWFQRGSKDNAPKYNSQELDKETGYYFYNARYYDGEIGRFVTPDTVIDGEFSAAGWNRYMYCAGNPILYKDPTGHRGTSNNGGTHGEHPANKRGIIKLNQKVTSSNDIYNELLRKGYQNKKKRYISFIKVPSGANLIRIAEAMNKFYKTDIYNADNISQLNNIKNKNKIKEGQFINVNPAKYLVNSKFYKPINFKPNRIAWAIYMNNKYPRSGNNPRGKRDIAGDFITDILKENFKMHNQGAWGSHMTDYRDSMLHENLNDKNYTPGKEKENHKKKRISKQKKELEKTIKQYYRDTGFLPNKNWNDKINVNNYNILGGNSLD